MRSFGFKYQVLPASEGRCFIEGLDDSFLYAFFAKGSKEQRIPRHLFVKEVKRQRNKEQKFEDREWQD